MKKLVLLLLLCFSFLQAREYKAVFDCSSSNAHYVKTRMWLIGKTIEMIEKKGDKVNIAITLHGGCVPMVSKAYDEIVDDSDLKDIGKAQEYLVKLSKKKNVKVIVCAMSLNANAMEQSEVLPSIAISENSFIDTIRYQNMGYALMTFK